MMTAQGASVANTPGEQRTILSRLKRIGITGEQAHDLSQTLDPESVESWSDEYLAFIVAGGSAPGPARIVIDGGTP